MLLESWHSVLPFLTSFSDIPLLRLLRPRRLRDWAQPGSLEGWPPLTQALLVWLVVINHKPYEKSADPGLSQGVGRRLGPPKVWNYSLVQLPNPSRQHRPSYSSSRRPPTSPALLQPQQQANLSWAAASLSCSSNKSLRPCQCPFLERFQAAVQSLFMEVQGCRLTGLKTVLAALQQTCSWSPDGRRAMSVTGGSRAV